MNDQRQTDSHCHARANQHRRGGAILDDPDPGMALRVQMVGEMLQRGIEQLRRKDDATREQHESPPERLHFQPRQRGRRLCAFYVCGRARRFGLVATF